MLRLNFKSQFWNYLNTLNKKKIDYSILTKSKKTNSGRRNDIFTGRCFGIFIYNVVVRNLCDMYDKLDNIILF